jgi:hypothetical protein
MLPDRLLHPQRPRRRVTCTGRRPWMVVVRQPGWKLAQHGFGVGHGDTPTESASGWHERLSHAVACGLSSEVVQGTSPTSPAKRRSPGRGSSCRFRSALDVNGQAVEPSETCPAATMRSRTSSPVVPVLPRSSSPRPDTRHDRGAIGWRTTASHSRLPAARSRLIKPWLWLIAAA